MNEDSALKELLNAMMKCLQLAKADGHKYTVLLFGNQELYCKKYDLQYTDKITFSSEEERTEFILDIQCDNFIAIYDLTEDLPKQLDIGSLRV